jgi:D-glycero-alpha-D-manno-heptose-7-phosphate kinase
MKELGERMLVVFSGEQHQSGLSNWEVFKGAMEGKPAILSGINRLAEIANQLDNELRSRNLSWKRVGQYLHEEWRVRREVFQVHTERLDSIVNLLMKNQVFGVKVCGAAQGGSLLAVVNPEQRLPLSKELRKLGIQVLDAAPCSHGVTVV